MKNKMLTRGMVLMLLVVLISSLIFGSNLLNAKPVAARIANNYALGVSPDKVSYASGAQINAAINLGLQWLRDNQNGDGSWTFIGEKSVGLSSMAILAFLCDYISEADPDVTKGLTWILSQQDPLTGAISNGAYAEVYDTSLAILALVATRNPAYDSAIQNAATFLIDVQNNGSTGYQLTDQYYGGWPYHQEMSDWADLSNTQFALLALHYAEMYADASVPLSVWQDAEIFVTHCQNREASNPDWNLSDDGGFIYQPESGIWGGGESYASITMGGLWGLYTTLYGLTGNPDVNDARVQAALGWLSNNYYVDRNYPLGSGAQLSTFTYYYLYGLEKACLLWNIHTIDGHDWYSDMAEFLVTHQVPSGATGYWAGTDSSEEPDNVATCWAILALESDLIPSGTGINIVIDSPADLLVTDPLGRHTGMNHGTDQVDSEIPDATYSGPGSEPQKVSIPNPMAGTYNITLFGTANGSFILSIEGLVGGDVTSTASYSGSITPGQICEATATISNIAGPMTIDTTSSSLTLLSLPTVTTQPATTITTTSATLNMNYTVGNCTSVDVRFAYKKSTDSAWSSTDWVSKSGNGTYAESLTGLTSNTEYEFKAQLKYDDTVIEGTSLQFTTSAGGRCFIATAAYGTPMAEEVQILREFRDEYLITNPLGQAFVDFYYKVSPSIAEFITEHPSLKPIVRAVLVPAIAMSTVAVNTTPVEKAAIIGLLALVSVVLAVWPKRRRGRGPQYT